MLRALAVDTDNEMEIDAKCKMIDYDIYEEIVEYMDMQFMLRRFYVSLHLHLQCRALRLE